jgi:5-methylcytosine-specific restriction protein A
MHRHYGPQCAACDMDFGITYGKEGKGLIHVHHLVPVAKIKRQYKIDPITDLRPVCPNCHAIVHRQEPPYTIAEVRRMMTRAGVPRSKK